MKLEKNTEAAKLRRYDDACGTGRTRWRSSATAGRSRLSGNSCWALGGSRNCAPTCQASARAFSRSACPILERRKVLVKTKLPPPAATPVYELTEWEYEAEPITSAMGRWAARSPATTLAGGSAASRSCCPSGRCSACFRRCSDLDACLGFRFGDDVYGARLTRNGLSVAQGDPPDPRVRFAGTPMALGAGSTARRHWLGWEVEGVLQISGDRRLAARFVTLFPLPERFDP